MQNSTSRKRVRSCISCGTKSSKQQLLRIVRTKDGDVHFDTTGRENGRGAYVCSLACFTHAQGGRLERALRVAGKQIDYERLAQELQGAFKTTK